LANEVDALARSHRLREHTVELFGVPVNRRYTDIFIKMSRPRQREIQRVL
jgi:hypothetical protein